MKRALQFRSIACRLSATNQRQYSTEKTVFPWRHSPVALDRTVTVDDLSGQPQNQLALFFRYILASRELNRTYFQILLQSAWRKELAADFSYAFQVGIASLLSELFQVKIDSIFKADEAIVDFNESIESNACTDAERSSAQSLTKTLLEETLWAKYQSLDPTTICLKLKIVPVDARIEHAFVVPVLTRASVKENPSIKGSYRNMEAEFQKNKDISQARQLANEIIDATGNIGVRTVIFDVSIDCIESFQIKDAKTGELIQGTDTNESKRVTHLVRFEMVTTPGDEGQRAQGSWQLVDWDDLSKNYQWY